jgi:hypothetical protein
MTTEEGGPRAIREGGLVGPRVLAGVLLVLAVILIVSARAAPMGLRRFAKAGIGE